MPGYKIDIASSGNNTIVAADTVGRRICVMSYALVAAGAVSVKWRSGSSTDLTGAMSIGATGGISSPSAGGSEGGYPLMETAANEALVLNLSAAVQVSGHVYVDFRR